MSVLRDMGPISCNWSMFYGRRVICSFTLREHHFIENRPALINKSDPYRDYLLDLVSKYLKRLILSFFKH